MTEIHYSEIKPLLSLCEEDEGEMHCIFRCPRTDFEVTSSAHIRRGQGLKDRLADRTVSSVGRNLRWSIWSKARQMLGYSLAGRVASDVLHVAVDEVTPTQVITETERQQAVVDAFRRVSSKFRHGSDGWVAATVEEEYKPEFVQQLKRHPIKLRYDRFILARVLAQLAEADGELSQQEMKLICTFAPPEFNAWGQPPTAGELQELSDGVKQTVLMLAWALVFCDTTLDHRELVVLLGSAGNLGLPAQALQDCKLWAQEYLVDQGFETAYQGGVVDNQALAQTRDLGAKLGLKSEQIERLEIRCQKRQGAYF
jgi:uncharacterized tellurite resistance protein B-like protein